MSGVWLAAGCYLIYRVAQSTKPDEFDVEALRRMKERFPNPGSLIAAVAHRLRHPPHWEIWEELEDTKKVRWTDDRQRCVAFYIVRAVELIQQGETLPGELPQELLFAVDLFRPIAERLSAKAEVWEQQTPGEDDVEAMIALHEQSRRDSEAAQRLLVKAADIPDSSVAALLEGFEEEYRIERGILGFLAASLGPGPEVQGDRDPDIERTALLPKKPFVRPDLGGDVNVAKMLGADLGRDWKRVEEREITTQLERTASESNGSGIEDGSITSIRDSIVAMRKADHPPDFLVLSRDLWVDLLRSGSYVPAEEGTEEGLGFRGRLDGVPVFFRPIDVHGLLVFLDAPHSRVAPAAPVLETSIGDDIVVRVRDRHGEVEEEAAIRVKIQQTLSLHLSADSEVRSV
jgi:hypothetical protein